MQNKVGLVFFGIPSWSSIDPECFLKQIITKIVNATTHSYHNEIVLLSFSVIYFVCIIYWNNPIKVHPLFSSGGPCEYSTNNTITYFLLDASVCT